MGLLVGLNKLMMCVRYQGGELLRLSETVKGNEYQMRGEVKLVNQGLERLQTTAATGLPSALSSVRGSHVWSNRLDVKGCGQLPLQRGELTGTGHCLGLEVKFLLFPLFTKVFL